MPLSMFRDALPDPDGSMPHGKTSACSRESPPRLPRMLTISLRTVSVLVEQHSIVIYC